MALRPPRFQYRSRRPALSRCRTHLKKLRETNVRSDLGWNSRPRHRASAHSLLRCALSLSMFTAMCLSLSGCGNGLAKVSGQVTLDGQPLRGGNGNVRVTVQFQPASGVGSTAIGLADENGIYILGTGSKTGIPPGEYFVTCSAQELVPTKTAQNMNGVRQVTDAKYANAKTSGLKFTVEPGKNQFDIPLQSARKRRRESGLSRNWLLELQLEQRARSVAETTCGGRV